MRKYETPSLEVTKFAVSNNIMDFFDGTDNGDGDIIDIETNYVSYPEIDDLEMFFYN